MKVIKLNSWYKDCGWNPRHKDLYICPRYIESFYPYKGMENCNSEIVVNRHSFDVEETCEQIIEKLNATIY